jgi:hypothetical protein
MKQQVNENQRAHYEVSSFLFADGGGEVQEVNPIPSQQST